jgi:hypothetical protein
VTLLVSTFEAGTAGATVSTSNSGGGRYADNAFDAVNIGTGAALTYDTTHAAHGSQAASLSTGASAAVVNTVWSTSMGAQAQVWFRAYCYFTANPGASIRLWNASATSSSCGSVNLTTAGKLTMSTGTAGTSQFTFTNVIPLNQWFRFEGFLIGDPAAGQVQLGLYSPMDSLTATETHTTAAINTTGQPNKFSFGTSSSVANVGPYWMDEIGLSSTAALGPWLPQPLALTAATAAAGVLTESDARAGGPA